MDKILKIRKLETRDVGEPASSEATLRKMKKERLSKCFCQAKMNC